MAPALLRMVLMSRLINRMAALAVVPLMASCAAEDDHLPFPMDGKGDFFGQTVTRGMLELGDFNARSGTFGNDLEVHLFELPTLEQGATVSVRTYGADYWDPVDTTLYLFGPAPEGDASGDLVAFDEDGGEGEFAAIEELRLEAGGRYRLVVGTADGLGRGHYNIEITCPSGDCVDEVDSTDLSAFDLDLSPQVQGVLDARTEDPEAWLDLDGYDVTSDPTLVSVEAVTRGIAEYYAQSNSDWAPVHRIDFSRNVASVILTANEVSLEMLEAELGLESYDVGAVEHSWGCNGDRLCDAYLIFFIPQDHLQVYVVNLGYVSDYYD